MFKMFLSKRFKGEDAVFRGYQVNTVVIKDRRNFFNMIACTEGLDLLDVV